MWPFRARRSTKGIVIDDSGQRLGRRCEKLWGQALASVPACSFAYSWASVPSVPNCTIAAAILFSVYPRLMSHDRNAAANAHCILIGRVGFIDEVRHPAVRPSGSRCEICQCVVTNHGSTPPGKRLPVLTPHRLPPIEHSLSSASNSAETRAAFRMRRRLRWRHRSCSRSRRGLRRPFRFTAQCKDDHTDRRAERSEYRVVGAATRSALANKAFAFCIAGSPSDGSSTAMQMAT